MTNVPSPQRFDSRPSIFAVFGKSLLSASFSRQDFLCGLLLGMVHFMDQKREAELWHIGQLAPYIFTMTGSEHPSTQTNRFGRISLRQQP